MSSAATSAIIFACVFGGALLGMWIRTLLPHHHLSSDSRDTIKLGTGLVATMAALVLGLLIASARESYDVAAGEVLQISTTVILLDRALTHYGPEADGIRDALRRAVAGALTRLWAEDDGGQASERAPVHAWDDLHGRIQRLTPGTDVQRALQAEALATSRGAMQTRWLLAERERGAIPKPFLILLVFWVTVIFASFGLFSPSNATVISALLVCSLSVAVAIFLILELDQPFDGIIKISAAPLRDALAQISR